VNIFFSFYFSTAGIQNPPSVALRPQSLSSIWLPPSPQKKITGRNLRCRPSRSIYGGAQFYIYLNALGLPGSPSEVNGFFLGFSAKHSLWSRSVIPDSCMKILLGGVPRSKTTSAHPPLLALLFRQKQTFLSLSNNLRYSEPIAFPPLFFPG